MHVARTWAGFTPASRQRLFERFRGLEVTDCPFVNLPEAKSGRLGRRTHERKDVGVSVAEAHVGWTI